MKKLCNLVVCGVVAGSGVLSGSAMAVPVNLVTNGDFSQTTFTQNTQFGPMFNGPNQQGLTGWTANDGYNLFYFAGTADSVSAITTVGGNPALHTLSGVSSSPTGGNVVALDGDSRFQGGISQMINNLVIGEQYTLNFAWGASQEMTAIGDTTEQIQVSLGNETYTTQILNNTTHGFTGWVDEMFTFTATSTSEILNFLSLGTPQGLPPIAVLANVSLTSGKNNNVPEPASLALLGLGLGVMGVTARKRRSANIPV